MRKKKILFSVLGLGALFTLASCGDNSNSEEIEKLKQEITQLKEENESLTNDKEALTNDKTAITDEKNQLEEEVDNLSKVAYPNKDNTNCRISLDEFNQISDISKISNDKDVIVKTYDIDDELLSIYKISLGENDTIFDKFTQLADVEYTNESWGPYVKSIDGMINDDKYYASIFVNDSYANNGIGLLDQELNDGDVVTFKPEFNSYSNPTYDEVDIKVDKIIYNYYKHAKEYANKIGYVDYNLAFAYKKLEKLGYDVDTRTMYSKTIKSRIVNNENNFSTDGSAFKTALAYYCGGFEELQDTISDFANRDVDINGQWNETNLAYYYNTEQVVGTNCNDGVKIVNKLKSLTLGMDETSCMIVTALHQIDSEICKNFDQTLKPGFTENGFGYSAYGYDTCNCSSTAQAILAFGAIGKNIRNDEYKVNDKDMIEALLSYYSEEDCLFYDFDGDINNLQYATPQAISALISYKLLKAGKSSNIYEA